MILFIHTQHLSSHFTPPPACLSALGAGETWRHPLFFCPSPFLALFPLCLPSLLPSNHCWLLVAIDIRGLIKPWPSCLIYTGGVWVVARKCGKDTSHLFHYLLSYSPGSGEDPARGSFCQLLDPAACFTSCTRVFSNKRSKAARWGWQKQTLPCFPRSAVRGFVQKSMTAVATSPFSMLKSTREARIGEMRNSRCLHAL